MAGAIVNLNSGAGDRASAADASAYNAARPPWPGSPAGLLAAGWAHGIRAFDLSPGVVRTDMTESMRAHVGRTEWTAPERVTDLVLALCSGELDAWSGRYVRAGVDTPASLRAQACPRRAGPDDRALRLHLVGSGRPVGLTAVALHRNMSSVYIHAHETAAVAGASGYAGGEILRLLLGAPRPRDRCAHGRLERRAAARRACTRTCTRWPTGC